MEASNSFSALDLWVHVQERGKEKRGRTLGRKDSVRIDNIDEPVRSSIMSFSYPLEKVVRYNHSYRIF